MVKKRAAVFVQGRGTNDCDLCAYGGDFGVGVGYIGIEKNKRAEINSRVLRLKYRPSHKKGPGSVNGGKFLTYGPVVYLR